MDPDAKSSTEELVLFICTGNFYRSRFAEALFNHHAQRLGLRQRAFSRGLGIHLAAGDLSHYTKTALDERGIDLSCTGPTRAPLAETDLIRAARIIALDEVEHRPMIQARFPGWESRITFWQVADIDRTTPERALGEIERKVLEMLEHGTR